MTDELLGFSLCVLHSRDIVMVLASITRVLDDQLISHREVFFVQKRFLCAIMWIQQQIKVAWTNEVDLFCQIKSREWFSDKRAKMTPKWNINSSLKYLHSSKAQILLVLLHNEPFLSYW